MVAVKILWRPLGKLGKGQYGGSSGTSSWVTLLASLSLSVSGPPVCFSSCPASFLTHNLYSPITSTGTWPLAVTPAPEYTQPPAIEPTRNCSFLWVF